MTLCPNKLAYYVKLINYVGCNVILSNLIYVMSIDSRYDNFNNDAQEFISTLHLDISKSGDKKVHFTLPDG